jgi:pimeloyl-ACP methyl ester carboxylesterase
MEPFYFRQSSKPLFGVYHPAHTGKSHNVGMVLCHPMGQEYVRSHRSLLQLALMLSSSGFEVLRFDYYGCGDSDGDCSQGSIEQWIEDISAAVDELNAGCNLDGVCIVGLRLAGALGIIVGSIRGDIDSVVLWDTVIDGKTYLEESIRVHEEWLEGSFARPLPGHTNHGSSEVLGFPMTNSMKAGLVDINLLALERKPARNMLVVESDRTADSGLLCECLRRVSVEPKYIHIPSSKAWIKHKRGDSGGLVPMPILKSIVNWICEVHQ